MPLAVVALLLQAAFWVPRYETQSAGNPKRLTTYIDLGIGDPQILNPILSADTAASEIYYNAGFPWQSGPGDGMDVESVALHEIGHSLGIGHIGPPLEAVMNPVYSGVHQALDPVDDAVLCSVWGRWPN